MKEKIASENIKETDTHVIFEFDMRPHEATVNKVVITDQEIYSYLLGKGYKILRSGATGRYCNRYNQQLHYEVQLAKETKPKPKASKGATRRPPAKKKGKDISTKEE